MKETKQAKENIANIRIDIPEERALYPKQIEHKQTCQRWLEFLENLFSVLWSKQIGTYNKKSEVPKKITDLKQAIKLYEDAGI